LDGVLSRLINTDQLYIITLGRREKNMNGHTRQCNCETSSSCQALWSSLAVVASPGTRCGERTAEARVADQIGETHFRCCRSCEGLSKEAIACVRSEEWCRDGDWCCYSLARPHQNFLKVEGGSELASAMQSEAIRALSSRNDQNLHGLIGLLISQGLIPSVFAREMSHMNYNTQAR
jgi:hypothetical protein